MDLFDRGKYFSSCVPVKVLDSPLLRYSAIAIAAKQLGCMQPERLRSVGESTIPATTQISGDAAKTDWSYKAATYYDRAISYLQLYLRQALPSHETTSSDGIQASGVASTEPSSVASSRACQISIAQETRDVSRRPFSQSVLDELLAATSILSVYDFLNHAGDGMVEVSKQVVHAIIPVTATDGD